MTEHDRARMRFHLEQIIKECRQTILDGESWADNRLEHPPIDIESFRVTLAKAGECLKALDAGDMAVFARRSAELADIDTE